MTTSPTYFSTIKEMISYPLGLEAWWHNNIPKSRQDEAAKALRKWLSQTPNRVETIACGDWYNGKGGYTVPSYKVSNVKLSKEQQIELYNFFNRPVRIEECFAFSSMAKVTTSAITTHCDNIEKRLERNS